MKRRTIQRGRWASRNPSMTRHSASTAAAAVLAAMSFVLGLWTLIRLELPTTPGQDYNVHLDVTPVSAGLLLAGVALAGLHRFLRRLAVKRAAPAERR